MNNNFSTRNLDPIFKCKIFSKHISNLVGTLGRDRALIFVVVFLITEARGRETGKFKAGFSMECVFKHFFFL